MADDPLAEQIAEQTALAATIKRLLAGHDPAAQGAVLAELLALFIAGHHPDIRDAILALHNDTVREMIPIAEAEIFEHRERPDDWPPIVDPDSEPTRN